jgi:hypothetical protein
MLTPTEHLWIVQAMRTLEKEEMSEMAMLKTYRTIGQMFEAAATRVELKLIDKVENRLYNTNTQTERV